MKISFQNPRTLGWLPLLLALALFSQIGVAQETKPKPKATPAAKSEGSPLGAIGDFLMTYEGLAEIKYGVKSAKMESFVVRKDVKLRSEVLNLNCDILKLNSNNVITAIGMPVSIVSEGFEGKCQALVYVPEEGKFTLTGKPELTQKGQDNPIVIKGETITIIQTEEEFTLLVDPGKKKPGVFQTEGVKPATIDLENMGELTNPKAKPTPASATPKKPVPLPSPKKKTTTAPKKLPSVSK